ncbi:SanA/YdcF family protein [Bacteroides oleiciplenus]|uniref:Vancomycin high temperature exclusion protein n=1 Tax=Bacteroides oleiciplenus TaxID=626931 RepID=A0A3E5BLC4_9BACE|nr:ElyC/SanA/YdcF family protein [Bacteroides oleiciplenus]RGN38426.1 vancomycin high temperature exclusion protein [Bacteroides oleiciplenus]
MKKLIKSSKWTKRIKWSILTGIFLILSAILCANYSVEHTAKEFIYQDVSSIPRNKAGLLLGTSKLLRSGQPNQYFQNRIQATVDLYKAGKIEVVVISGDNSREGYNEPEDMKSELVQQGIPENKIYLDYAGFRTLDSVIRMEKIFGQKNFTIISQNFHNQRAIYIAHAKGLQAIGFNAENVNAYSGFKTQLREKFARVKLFLDLWTGKNPKFLGEPIVIQ